MPGTSEKLKAAAKAAAQKIVDTQNQAKQSVRKTVQEKTNTTPQKLAEREAETQRLREAAKQAVAKTVEHNPVLQNQYREGYLLQDAIPGAVMLSPAGTLGGMAYRELDKRVMQPNKERIAKENAEKNAELERELERAKKLAPVDQGELDRLQAEHAARWEAIRRSEALKARAIGK